MYFCHKSRGNQTHIYTNHKLLFSSLCLPKTKCLRKNMEEERKKLIRQVICLLSVDKNRIWTLGDIAYITVAVTSSNQTRPPLDNRISIFSVTQESGKKKKKQNNAKPTFIQLPFDVTKRTGHSRCISPLLICW